MSERSGGAQEEARKRDVPPRLGKKKQFDGFVQDNKLLKKEQESRQKKKKELPETQGKKRKDSLDKPEKEEEEVPPEEESPEKGKDQTKQPRQKRKRKPESEKGNGSSDPPLLLENKAEAGQLLNHDLHPDLTPEDLPKELHRSNSKTLIATPIHLKTPRDKVEDSTEDEVDASLDPAYGVVMPLPTDALSASKAKRPKFPIGHDKAAPEPTTISAARRIKQFPNQGLRPHPEEECLYCEICCTSVSRIKQRIRTHLQTFKHRQGMGGKICREQVPPDEGLYVDPAARMQAFNAMITASSPPEQLYGDLRGLRRIMDGGHYFQPRMLSSQISEFVDTPASVHTINFGIGQPSPSILPMDLMQKACRSLENRLPRDRELLTYGEGQGYLSFRASLAHFLSRQYQCLVKPEELAVTAGNSGSLLLAATMPETKEVLIYAEDPTYFLAHGIFKRARCTVRGFPVDDEGLRVDLVAAALDEADAQGLPKPQLLYTIPTFHNPTGTCLSAARRKILIDLAVKHKFLIIADEPYNLLTYDGIPKPSLVDDDQGRGVVLSLGSFSKILAPGLRLGWVHGTPALVSRFRNHGAIVSSGCLNPLMAAMVHQLLDDGSLDHYLDSLKRTLGTRMQVMLGELKNELPPSVAVFEPRGGYFVWLRMPGNAPTFQWEGAANAKIRETDLVTDESGERKVFFTPGARCSSLGIASPSASCLRLSVAMYGEDEIRVGVRSLAKIVRFNLDKQYGGTGHEPLPPTSLHDEMALAASSSSSSSSSSCCSSCCSSSSSSCSSSSSLDGMAEGKALAAPSPSLEELREGLPADHLQPSIADLENLKAAEAVAASMSISALPQ